MTASVINATVNGINATGGNTAELELQVGGTTAITVNSAGYWVLANALPVASGGTGSNTATFSGANITSLNASNISSGTLAVARGGTGAATLTANNVILGNGTSAVTFVAPGTSSNVLTSNGTAWVSQAAPTPSSSVGAVGTYALLRNANNTTLNAGDTVTGGLEYANSGGSSSGSASGTWRCMGYTEGGAGNARLTTLFLRIS